MSLLTEQQVIRIIRQLHGSVGGPPDPTSRFGPLHGKIMGANNVSGRRDHYFNLPAADYIPPKPYDKAQPYQSDIIRRTHRKLRARIAENHFVVRVKPPQDTSEMRRLADKAERTLNAGLQLVEERERLDLQGLLADGQSLWCYGILHWLKAEHIWPAVPDYEYLDELPDEPAIHNRFRPENGRYRETDKSLQDRHHEMKARAGFPWFVESPHPATFSFIEDRSTANGMAVSLVVRSVALLDYQTQLFAGDKLALSINEVDDNIRVYGEQDRPPEWLVEGVNIQAWGRPLYVAQLWTRDEFYEMATVSGDSWVQVKADKHPYTMPPFAIAVGAETNEAAPELRFQPEMEGLYRLKPSYDRDMTLAKVMAEMIAMPFFYIKTAEGAVMLDPEGKPLMLSRHNLSAYQLPPGASLEKVDYTLDDAFIAFLDKSTAELKEAAPSVGESEIGASTQPWAIRLQQQERSMEPRRLIQSQALAIRTMVRNMLYVMSLDEDAGGFGEGIYVYAREKKGQKEQRTLVGIEPKEITGLEVEVDINPNSQAEVISLMKLGADELEAGRITEEMYYEEFANIPDAGERVRAVEANNIYKQYLRDGMIKQVLKEKYGKRIVLGAEGEFVGFDGQVLTPEQVLQQNGQVPVPTAPAPGENAGQQAAMPGLPQVNAPGTIPLGGVPG